MNDEKSIIERLKQKDEECFIEVVNSYKKKVLALCYSYIEDYYEAEDLSQEVFTSLYKSIDKFRGNCSLSTYIYKITVSKCLDYKRKKSLKGFLTDMFHIQKAEEPVDLDEKIFVRQCIKKLSKDLRLVVVLYYYIGFSQKEIGEILNITPRAVEGKIYRAKKKLKNELKKEDATYARKMG
ncbi:RNA polymerase sigma factor [Clostridium aestuarii]|uniref:RNA polymerase sigma factor n=1 Tax=Clostridium aestuarii TaxID=338193 RepID=A0ABT4D477_9CLOT|nr:RNA polymerase sigma factor [Clostridium aestuarii]MCY6485452.1 RNA polymerase sigma factor [Clostridium aestuarii]